MKFIKLLTLVVLPSLLFAHGKIAHDILDAQNEYSFPEYTITQLSNQSIEDLGLDRTVEQGVLLDLNQEEIQKLFTAQHEALSLVFQTAEGPVKLDLLQNKVLADDFLLRKSSDRKNAVSYDSGLFYNGIVSGDLHSLASVSIFEDEIMVFIHKGVLNTVIGKLKDSKVHIAYNDNDLTQDFELDCSTEDDGEGYSKEMLSFDETRTVGDCIRVYYEIDDDIVSNKGGVTGATNYLVGLMNETITLYANDGITMVISEILAWDTPAPYSGSSSSAMLASFQNNTGNFNGDLSHLISYQASGGIAAGFSGICNPNVDNSKCFSSIDSYYNNVPAYSYTIMVVTHEMGHLIGSRHTHACVWNGNNTAIDGCAGYVEGNCSLPGSPSNGGTIMSYCHVATGIDFTQGFGPQPRAVLLNTIANSNCTSPCGTGPTCNDGIQNGDETGVDCGGSSCPPCSGGCTDNDVNISITFDNYPEETSWQITNSNGSVVASGGTYASQPDGSTLSIDLCLVDDCYDFTIFDSYGDGICCGYGNGSYTVSSGGTTLASGGSFTTSETTNFCFGGPPAPTCDDGIQNGDETGVDCGGSVCDPCNTGGEILGSYFETGWDGWADGGSDCFRYSGSRSYEGNYSIRIRDNSGTASAMTSPTLNLSGYSSITVEFYFYAYSMENGEDFWLRYYDGSSWSTVGVWARGTSFNNNTFYVASVTLDASNVNFSSNSKIRFQCDASGNADHVYIDQVTVTATAGTLNESPGIITTISETEQNNQVTPSVDDSMIDFKVDTQDIKVFPNPANDIINISSNEAINNVNILSVSGQVVKVLNSSDLSQGINIADLNPGVYYLLIETEGEFIPKKFIKL